MEVESYGCNPSVLHLNLHKISKRVDLFHTLSQIPMGQHVVVNVLLDGIYLSLTQMVFILNAKVHAFPITVYKSAF